MLLKDRFLNAIIAGDLGKRDEYGDIVVELSEVREYFSDIKTSYVGSFLPASTVEAGRTEATSKRFLFRIGYGIYRVHPDAIAGSDQQQNTSTILDLIRTGLSQLRVVPPSKK
ncbi:hypothetical protein MNBD_GAMMA10-545 [hydrothermal vent metagenome]|uniref:Uncharacterized protein n=1 Tax=hydrothermal vent metagenome TaxID=652676 RepID=A0A3B0Y4H1_9ZZZZ